MEQSKANIDIELSIQMLKYPIELLIGVNNVEFIYGQSSSIILYEKGGKSLHLRGRVSK